jgi:hypothetical protein
MEQVNDQGFAPPSGKYELARQSVQPVLITRQPAALAA